MITSIELKPKGVVINDNHLAAHIKKFQGDGLIKSAPGFSGLLGQVRTRGKVALIEFFQISAFRTSLTDVATYGHIPVPLVYTQVRDINPSQ